MIVIKYEAVNKGLCVKQTLRSYSGSNQNDATTITETFAPNIMADKVIDSEVY